MTREGKIEKSGLTQFYVTLKSWKFMGEYQASTLKDIKSYPLTPNQAQCRVLARKQSFITISFPVKKSCHTDRHGGGAAHSPYQLMRFCQHNIHFCWSISLITLKIYFFLLKKANTFLAQTLNKLEHFKRVLYNLFLFIVLYFLMKIFEKFDTG